VTRWLADPRALQVAESVGIFLGAYLAARLLSFACARLLVRATARTPSKVDDRIVAALRRPITYTVVLAGAWAALHHLPSRLPTAPIVDGTLFVLGVLLGALALIRAWDILMGWYMTESRHAARDGLAREFGPLFGRLGVIFIVVLATIALLTHFGVNVASLVVSLGVGSLAIGLAAQDTLSNMFAGFTLMADRPFRVGDRIRLASGETGDVQEVGMRATLIQTLDETLLVVPNSLLVKERVVNLSRPSRRITTRIEVGVAYGSDLPAVRRVLAEAALGSEYTDPERTPVVLVTRFADFFVNVLLIFWVRDYAEQGLAVSQVHEEIDRRFRERGIEIPFPVRRLIGEPAAAAPRAQEAT
jgi:small-conductance mechanosensitive channel